MISVDDRIKSIRTCVDTVKGNGELSSELLKDLNFLLEEYSAIKSELEELKAEVERLKFEIDRLVDEDMEKLT